MKPSAPNKILWALALILGILGLIGHLTSINYVSEHSFMLVLAGFILLAIGTSFKGT